MVSGVQQLVVLQISPELQKKKKFFYIFFLNITVFFAVYVFFNDNTEGYSIILQLLNTTLYFTKTCKIICMSEIITLRQIHLLLFNVDYYLTSTMQKPTCCLLTTRIATTTKVNPVPEYFLLVA